MKPYLVITGTVFGLMTLLHLWHGIAEWPDSATDPWNIVLTLAAGALSFWAWRLFWLGMRGKRA
jgi:hypothetical protein